MGLNAALRTHVCDLSTPNVPTVVAHVRVRAEHAVVRATRKENAVRLRHLRVCVCVLTLIGTH